MHNGSTIRVVVAVASTTLIASSCGFAALFAWKLGANYSVALACLMTAFAVAADALKPLALQAAFNCFAGWQVVRGLALGLLAAVIVAYSLTAELSLSATSRQDLIASRSADTKKAASGEAVYTSAIAELKTLANVRTKEQLQADILKLQADYPRILCQPLGGPQSRAICPEIEKLRGQQSLADRKAKLEAVVERYSQAPTVVQKLSDPASHAIQVYLASVGVSAEADTITNYLTLIFVLCLELGSSLSMVLLAAVNGSSNSAVVLQNSTVVPQVVPLVPEMVLIESDIKRQQRLRKEAAALIMNQLRDHNGAVHVSERDLANHIKMDRNTVRRALQDLDTMNVVDVTPTKKGTKLRLVASQK